MMSSLLDDPSLCWRTARARRLALLIDGANYFAALHQALLKARHQVFVLGWDINSAISLDPEGEALPLSTFLSNLLRRRRGLRIHLLIWDWPVFFGLDRQFMPQLRFGWRGSRRLSFVFDGDHPAGGCQHEKLVVVDGELAFCGGIDLTVSRWDRREHHADEPIRARPDGTPRPPFHDAMLMVEGEPARALEELARERWHRASGERLPPSPAERASPWPDTVEPWLEGGRIGIARTRPAPEDQPAVREVLALYRRTIRSAERCIYIENQYLTVKALAEALAERLATERGPEVVIIGPKVCEGVVETAVMDRGRKRFLDRLRRADRFDRLRVSFPVNGAQGEPAAINVHAKLMTVDDRLLLVGSANLANRSMQLDSECVLVLEAEDEAGRRAVARSRAELLSEHLGCSPERLTAEVAERGGWVPAFDALNGGPRHLVPLEIEPLDLPPELAAGADLTDPDEPLTVEAIERRLAPHTRRRRLRDIAVRGALLVLVLLAIVLAARSDLVSEQGTVTELLRWAEQHKVSWLGVSGVIVAFVVASLVLVPVNLVIALTAAAFGPWIGFVYALLGALLAAGVTFALGRHLGRHRVRRIAGRRVNAVRRRLERHGLWAMTLLRLMPVAPFGVVNVVAGASELRTRDFLLGSLIGMSPGLVVMTAFGDRLGAWLRNPDGGNLLVLCALALLVLALAVALRHWARRRVRR